jgi:microcystin-dependent protein
MSCTSCYNGCVETTTDQCVQYTGGNSVPLGIETGDNLLTVEQALIEKVVSFLDGSGISIAINPSYYCTLVSQYLTETESPTVPELFAALVRAACNLQTQTTANTAAIATLNADYSIGCLTGVTASSDTHDIVQAVITKLCATSDSLAALSLDLSTNYVKLADLNTLIQAYLNSISGGSTQQYTKMVPYTAVEYYGPLTNFDATGAGFTNLGWDKIFLCNGANGTPDKRGRVGVGAIQGVPGGPLNINVDPVYPGNPNYALTDTAGSNSVTLNITQIPSHTHAASATATSTVSPNPHSHTVAGVTNPGGKGEGDRKSVSANITTSSVDLSVSTVVNVTNSNAGNDGAHPNIQPVLACYYIMYIP